VRGNVLVVLVFGSALVVSGWYLHCIQHWLVLWVD